MSWESGRNPRGGKGSASIEGRRTAWGSTEARVTGGRLPDVPAPSGFNRALTVRAVRTSVFGSENRTLFRERPTQHPVRNPQEPGGHPRQVRGRYRAPGRARGVHEDGPAAG